jgi:hypothetical protein
MATKIFSQSQDMKQEYCASIVRIGEVKPIEGSDFLGVTLVNGIEVVVRKDAVTEGQIMFFAPQETALNLKFLSVNNQFELGEYEQNANADEVRKLKDEGKTEEAKQLVGYFNKRGRVRAMKLRGIYSKGFLISPEMMAVYNPKVANLNLEELVGTDFDMVDDELFIEVYIPFVPKKKDRSGKRGKDEPKYDRMIAGQFAFHYDTNPLAKEIAQIQPDDVVTLSVKLHGTSVILGNVLVRMPKEIHTRAEWFNRMINNTYCAIWPYLPKALRRYEEVYDLVYSSRTVIKNQYINLKRTRDFYEADVWGEYHDLLVGKIPQDMIVYGEIIGYLTDSDKMIQKDYDYGCERGTNKLMPYRVTTRNADGTRREWDVTEVQQFTKQLMADYSELAPRLHPIDILYHGTLKDLYPDLSTTEHWHENVLKAMKQDKQTLGMEQREPLCKQKVPREGIVLRKDGDAVCEAWKLKTDAFFSREQKLIDAGEVDMELMTTV